MKKTHLLLVVLSIMAVLFMGCPEPDSPKPTPTPPDNRTELNAGTPVTVLANVTSAQVHFTGSTGLVLTKNDFTVTTGGTISNTVTNSGGTATLTVTFAANTSSTERKTYTVGIATTSTVIKGNATVTITQLKTDEAEPLPIVGTGANADPTQTSASVTFTGTDIIGKTFVAADFTVTGGASISSVSTNDNTVTVNVSFSPNTTAAEKEYVVSFSTNKVNTDATAKIAHFSPNDTRTTLTAGTSPIEVIWAATGATANFSGATGLTLTAADFTVTTGATITTVTVTGATAAVDITFAANTNETDDIVYTVGIASSSTIIRGSATVNIIQDKHEKKALTAGHSVDVLAEATSAVATFTGASGLPLTAADFTITAGGTISNVSVTNDTVSVTVTFAANSSTSQAITYTVGISATSDYITGSATVAILHAKIPLPALALDPATNYLNQNYEGANTTLSWTKLAGNSENTGDVPEALVVDPADNNNKVGSYSINGSGSRAAAFNFAAQDTVNVVVGDIIVAEFDWYPNIYSGSNRGPLYISLNDARTTAASVHGKKIITFVNENESSLKYRLGTFNDTEDPLAGAVAIPGTEDKTKWYKFQVIIDFNTSKLSRLYVYDKATDVELYSVGDVDLVVGETPYNHEVRTIRIYSARVDGTHTTYLDNVFVGNGARTEDTRTLLTAGPAVGVKASATSAVAVFNGVTGVPPNTLTTSDFTATTGGTVSSVAIDGNAARVTVTFDANTSEENDNFYTVGISPTSAAIRGITTVTITHAKVGHVELAAGTPVNVNCFATSAVATFTDSTNTLTTEDLLTTDFTVDNGGTVTGVAVLAPGTVSVTVGFTRNSSDSVANTYIVGISASSDTVKGSATVTVTQAIFTKLTLTAGAAVSITNSATSGIATFNNAENLATADLTTDDFTVTAGGTIASVAVTGSSVSVTVTFAAGDGTAATYTVGIAADRPYITGAATVGITQTVASFLEDFSATAVGDLAWTAVTSAMSGSGAMTQVIDNGNGLYSGTGSGFRGLTLSFKPQNVIISDDKVYVNFDWAPIGATSFTSRGPAFISINAFNGTGTAAALNDKKCIAFIVHRVSNTSHQLFYRVDNFGPLTDSAVPGAPAVEIGTATNLVDVWYNIDVVIDFGADKLSFTITPKAGGDPVATVTDLPLNNDVKDLNRIVGLHIENNRVDGTWVPRLDNVYVGTSAKP